MTEPPALRPVEAAEAGDTEAQGPVAGITPPRRRGGGTRFLSDVIAELGFVSEERVKAAVGEGRESGRTPEHVLLESGALTPEQLARALAERFGLEHVDLAIYKPDLGATNLITPQAARRYEAVPIGFDPKGVLLVAMAEPSNVLALDDLKLMTGHEIRPVVASREDITALISRMNRLDDAVAEAVDEQNEEELAVVSDIRVSAVDAPVV